MAPVKCEQCGREFKNDLALKIHAGRQHAGKSKAKAAAKKAAPAGATTCKICGRTFALPLHLGRHFAATHAKAAKPAKRAKRAARPVAARAPTKALAGISAEVQNLSIDQLIGLKAAVDARLAEIVRFIRQAKVSI